MSSPSSLRPGGDTGPGHHVGAFPRRDHEQDGRPEVDRNLDGGKCHWLCPDGRTVFRGDVESDVAGRGFAVNDDLREVAERLIQSCPPDAVHEGIYSDMDEMAADAVVVASAVLMALAEHPEDDADYITADWLRMNSYDRLETLAATEWIHPELEIGVQTDSYGEKHLLVSVMGNEMPHLKTRGQLRRLLAALKGEPC